MTRLRAKRTAAMSAKNENCNKFNRLPAVAGG
jgi:hypothetical protein